MIYHNPILEIKDFLISISMEIEKNHTRTSYQIQSGESIEDWFFKKEKNDSNLLQMAQKIQKNKYVINYIYESDKDYTLNFSYDLINLTNITDKLFRQINTK